MRFGQNVLRMTWKERFVQFAWKAHCFPVLNKISRQCKNFDNVDAQKCDLAKTCCAWPEKNVCTIFTKSAQLLPFEENLRQVWRFWKLCRSQMRFGQNVLRMTWKERLYNFYEKRTVFTFGREFETSVTILKTLPLTNAIWPKRAAHDLKRTFVQFLWKARSISLLKRIWDKCDDFENFDAHKCDLAKTCCAWPKNNVSYNFHRKRTVFPFLREFQASVTILTTLTLKNAIWPRRAAHDLKRGFCTIFMKSALFCLFGENLRQVWRSWQLWRSEMRFGQNVLRMTWKERLYNFYEKRTVFTFWREFHASVRILTTLTPKNAIWPKRAARDLKRTFVQFLRKAHSFYLLKRIWDKCDDFDNFDAQKCDLAKTCCSWPEKRVLYNFHEKRTVFTFWREFETSVTILKTLPLTNAIWPKRAAHDLKRTFVQFLWKARSFSLLKRIWDKCDDFENFDAHKCDLAKTCCSWPEKRVLYNFHEKRTFLPFWREFEASVTILTTMTLRNAKRPKRAPHDLKRGFCTIFMESAPFSHFGENVRPVWRFWQLWRSEMRKGQNVPRMTWKEGFVQFLWKAHCFPTLERMLGQCDNFDNFDAQKCDLGNMCCAWPKKTVLYNFHEKRTVFPYWRKFKTSVTILRTLTLKNAIWQNVLRMTEKDRFVQFSWRAHCFPVLNKI